MFQLRVSGVGELKKFQQVGQSLARVSVSRFRFASFGDAIFQNVNRRINLAFFSFAGDDAKHGENVLHRFKVVAAITGDVDDVNDAPMLELTETGAGIGAGDAES